MWVVDSVRFCAGLMPGKYLRTPMPRTTAPTAIRNAVMLCNTN
jgi:hypothetical protein